MDSDNSILFCPILSYPVSLGLGFGVLFEPSLYVNLFILDDFSKVRKEGTPFGSANTYGI